MATKNVIITGASGALGAATLAAIAQRDVNAICVDLDRERVQGTLDGLGPATGELVAVGADVASETDVQGYVLEAVDRWGGLDGIFNIAGIGGEMRPLLEATIADYDNVARVNARSVFLSIHFGLKHLIERGGGTVINTGSYLAIRGAPSLATYVASKHAVVGLTKTLALEVATQNVRANVLSPGLMDTPINTNLYPQVSGDRTEAEAALVARIPMRRMARPDELAQTGTWLLLDAPEHLTGQVITVDGGRSAG